MFFTLHEVKYVLIHAILLLTNAHESLHTPSILLTEMIRKSSLYIKAFIY